MEAGIFTGILPCLCATSPIYRLCTKCSILSEVNCVSYSDFALYTTLNFLNTIKVRMIEHFMFIYLMINKEFY